MAAMTGFLYSKTLGQEKYQFLRYWTEALEQFTKKEVASFHSAADDIIPADKLNLKERSIMVFEDAMIEKNLKNISVSPAMAVLIASILHIRIPKQAMRDTAMQILSFCSMKKTKTRHDTFLYAFRGVGGGLRPYLMVKRPRAQRRHQHL